MHNVQYIKIKPKVLYIDKQQHNTRYKYEHIKCNPYEYIYIEMIRSKQREWIILNAVDSRRKKKTWKKRGEVSAEIGRKRV